MNRLPEFPTQRINSSHKISFTYGSKKLQGIKGDTVATALFANGIRIFSRSFKFHRPRGLYSLDGESSNCLMEIDRVPNVFAEMTMLQEGMVVRAQNVKGSADCDFMAVAERFDWALLPGFYYERFHKPYRLWPLFQKTLRAAAGIGKLNPNCQVGCYDGLHLNVEVCVIGGGPAGMSAALAAAKEGLRVVILESRPWLGGFYDWRIRPSPSGQPLYTRAADLVAEVKEQANIRVFTTAPMMGFHGGNLVTAFQVGRPSEPFVERFLQIRTRSMVVATGCLERPLLFENNERPGVMQACCAHRLARTYGLSPGTSAVFTTGHDLMLEAALDLTELGVEVVAVADCRSEGHDEELVSGLENRRIPFLPGFVAAEARGKKLLSGVTLTTLNGSNTKSLTCDLLVASAGLTANSGPLALARTKLAFDEHTGFFLPNTLPKIIHPSGRLLGLDDPTAIEASGRLAGLQAARDCGTIDNAAIKEAYEVLHDLPGSKIGSKLVRAPGPGRKAFVCFDEDVTVRDICHVADKGFDSAELCKRYSAAGTGPSQSGIPGANLPLVLAEYKRQPPGSILPTNVRSPLIATSMVALAGRNYHLYKRTPLHNWQRKMGGSFRQIGAWKRVGRFSGEPSARDEIENVHTNVGMMDVSTLGKFRIFGLDSVKALQRIYVNDLSRMTPGKMKYVAACNEDGALIDDGLIAQIGKRDYYFTTSSARADGTIEWFRYHARFEDWDFHMVNLTDACGAISLSGPNSRLVLEKVTDADVSNEALPYFGFKEITLRCGIPARTLRLGFCGELGFELHVPASLCQTVWDLLLEGGQEYGIKPFGLEAMNVLRLEKGHVIIGVDSEQIINLLDLGLGFLWDRNKKGTKTVGLAALRQMESQPGRQKLVGFRMDNPWETPADGAIVVDTKIRGRVTSCCYSQALKESIGLTLVEEPLAQVGGRLEIFEAGMDRDRRFNATVVSPPFYDPEGKRLRM